jgi:catechol 2,3-dioxygenase-like lactoylglutathione lyase family enzyme
MIHHVSLGTADAVRAKAFYDPLMALLGLRGMMHDDEGVHYGTGEILFSLLIPEEGSASAGNGAHVAFIARDRAMVDEFHRLALAGGGTSDGGPGTRPRYDANYYAAFVRDPDGNKIEAVTFSAV